MKDENDKSTLELPRLTRSEVNARARERVNSVAAEPQPFDYFGRFVVDSASSDSPLPGCAKVAPVPGHPVMSGQFVPVSFVAKDWNVTSRRIRALLTAGRLAGRLLPNGYWEVRFPYLFSIGTRGPELKRSQKPKKPNKRLELVASN